MKESIFVWSITINICLIIVCAMLVFMLYKQGQVLNVCEDVVKDIRRNLDKKEIKNGKFVCSYGRI